MTIALTGARVTVNFHPDRAARDGRCAAQGLAADGVYRTQFETGTSAGGLDLAIGGARSRWERAMFAGAYDGAAPAERPRYGGLDVLGYPDGACPRFGSTHLRLRSSVLPRCTLSWGDSVTEPTLVVPWQQAEKVLDAAARAGMPEAAGHPRSGPDRIDGDIIEAHVHGGLTMTDVEAVVTDPSYRGTAVEHWLAIACERYGAALEWHAGYALAPVAMGSALRGTEPLRLAAAITERLERDVLDPELLGRAAAAIAADPTAWPGPDDPAELLQHLKYVWHHLAAYGYREPG